MSRNIEGIGWQAESSLGAIAAGGAGAVDAGMQILEAGGNAADAAAATLFALQVTDHVACCIGGEVPLLIYDAGRREVKSLSGMGRSPLSPTAIDWYMANGIPGPGDMKMAPVPSVVGLCITTMQRYGTLSLEQIVTPTLAILDIGTREWEPKLAHTLRRMVEEESLTDDSREQKLQAACDRFYGRNPRCSDIGEELEAEFIRHGSFLRLADLQAHRTRVENPVVADYRGYTVCKCDTWTQGPALLQALRLLEGFDVQSVGHLSADYVHLAVEALKLAFADRDRYYGDPEFAEVPLASLLCDAYTELRRPLIDMETASTEARPGDPHAMQAVVSDGVFRPGGPGTTTCVVADRWGNVVAATPSANVDTHRMDGGQAGVTYGNRLRSLNTTPGHPNCIEPGKRPRITLTPTLVLKDDRPAFAISVAGGDRQDQTALHMLLGAIDFGLSPVEIVRVPRFSTFHHQNSFDPSPQRDTTFTDAGALEINNTVPESTRRDLERRGHPLLVKEQAISNPVMLRIAGDTIQAAGDPDAGRHAAGL
ncbi:MAG: gamma-glutamyltransferase [Candidatus Latescibacteria bacterium]|jgi:gamma-glutamyltranspeptidase/glutathione hydrolase|nr:gamma-glutamyltransferase [Candidatus Latescibacterota bacterium]MDP7447229.1 gamma-glutamyltransferase [Candidatus Latescibacterota bacterium]HJP29292.1 gamma-glutamyltransferase [Candidatus Latescibacterota bacterium]